MIREIVANFISNAIKYTPASGFINILVSNDEKNLAVVVENTGYGIPVLEQEKIFSKFYRASNIVKQGLKGTGLGLYTSKRLAESMGGTVGFESVENETTKFWVYLPIS
jgi:signal transduction histidine kinase